mgnify:CR=1 FL=1
METVKATCLTIRAGTKYQIEDSDALGPESVLDADVEASYIGEIGCWRLFLVSGETWFILKSNDL